MVKKFNKWLRLKVLYPWLNKNRVECTVILYETIVLQMHKAGIRMEHINKWLRLHQLPVIKAYTITENKELRVFWKTAPTAEERRDIKTTVYLVA
jgi:hypothetical protein